MTDLFDFDNDGKVSDEEEEDALLLLMDDDDDEEPPRSSHAGGCLTSVIMAFGVTVALSVLLFHI